MFNYIDALSANRDADNGQLIASVALDALPTPAEDCAWQALLEFKHDMTRKKWAFHRWVRSMAAKRVSHAASR
jgi:hypothetical protein